MPRDDMISQQSFTPYTSALLVLTLTTIGGYAFVSLRSTSVPHIRHLLRTLSSTHLHLFSTPRDRFSSLLTVSLAILLLLLKHLGLGPAIKSKDVREDGTLLLPDLRITAPVFISQEEFKAYNALIREVGPTLSPSEGDGRPLLLLAPLITPLIPSLLILRKSPIKPLGAVNVRNTFMFHRPDVLRRLGNDPSAASHLNSEDGDERSQRKAHKVKGDDADGKGMVVSAQMGGELLGRKMKRGVEFDTLLTVSTSSSSPASTDTSDPIFSFTFTTLSLLPLRSAPLHTSARSPKADDKDSSITSWHNDTLPLSLSAISPLLWARLSKDYNPIHTSSICARLLGLRGKIAHGNMILAFIISRACQAYTSGEGVCEAQLDLGKIWTGDVGASWMTVEFRRPVFVPSRPLVRWSQGRVQVYEIVKRSLGGGVGGDEEVKVLVDIRAGKGIDVPSSHL